VDLNAVAAGLAAAVDAIDGVTTYSYTPDAVTVPAFYVGEITTDFDAAMNRGLDELSIVCRMVVEKADMESAQHNLNRYMAGSGALSVKAALEAARGAPGDLALPSADAPDGSCDDLRVRRISGHRLYTVGTTVYLGCEFIVQIIGSGED
jgi:hypothetical protein